MPSYLEYLINDKPSVEHLQMPLRQQDLARLCTSAHQVSLQFGISSYNGGFLLSALLSFHLCEMEATLQEMEQLSGKPRG